MSKLDANKLTLERNYHNISLLLNKLYGDYKALFDKKEIDFNLYLSDNNLNIYVDANFIKKAIGNLLNNALKFTPKRGTVNITAILDTDLIIGITDDGLGIPKEDFHKIFERFYQSKNHITKSQGSGIGLSFTKSILNAHNFDIDVISKPNVNTTFNIKIPKKYIDFNIRKNIEITTTK